MIPLSVAAHTEAVEAADPATPAALLGFRSAAGGYARPETEPRAWREIFTGDRESNPMMGDHAGHMMQHDSATMQQ